MTQAHFQTVSFDYKIRTWTPEHAPREHDPHYNLFHRAKRKMKQLDLPCWRCGVRYEDLVGRGDPPTQRNPLAAYQLEAHHSDCEFSVLNAVDVEKWWSSSHAAEVVGAYYDSSSREDGEFMVQSFSQVDRWLEKNPQYSAYTHDRIFEVYMEDEGNLMQLCDVCHRDKRQGIHELNGPMWRMMKVWQAGQPPYVQAA